MIPIKLFTQGVLSRSVRDTASYFHHAEQIFKNPNLPEIGLVDKPGKKRLRIGMFIKLSEDAGIDAEVENTVINTSALCQELGHSVEPIPNPFDQNVFDDFVIYWCMLAFYTKYFDKYLLGLKLDRDKFEPFTNSLCRHFMKKGITLPFVISRLKRMAREYDNAFAKYDVILSPTVGTPAPKLGYLDSNKGLHEQYDRLKEFVPYCCFQNISGGPAISLPLGFSQNKGLPIGIQFAAPVGQDKRLLELAFELEQAAPWRSLAN